MEKPSVIDFYRYIRFEEPYTDAIDPLSGVTFKFVLDYANNTMTVSMAVCDGENFVTSKGREMVDTRMAEGDFVKFVFNKLKVPTRGCTDTFTFLMTKMYFVDRPNSRRGFSDVPCEGHLYEVENYGLLEYQRMVGYINSLSEKKRTVIVNDLFDEVSLQQKLSKSPVNWFVSMIRNVS